MIDYTFRGKALILLSLGSDVLMMVQGLDVMANEDCSYNLADDQACVNTSFEDGDKGPVVFVSSHFKYFIQKPIKFLRLAQELGLHIPLYL